MRLTNERRDLILNKTVMGVFASPRPKKTLLQVDEEIDAARRRQREARKRVQALDRPEKKGMI